LLRERGDLPLLWGVIGISPKPPSDVLHALVVPIPTGLITRTSRERTARRAVEGTGLVLLGHRGAETLQLEVGRVCGLAVLLVQPDDRHDLLRCHLIPGNTFDHGVEVLGLVGGVADHRDQLLDHLGHGGRLLGHGLAFRRDGMDG